MGISAASNVAAIGMTSAPTRSFENSQLDSMDFLTLMIQELVNQDPLDPMKNEALLTQISQIKNMETLTNLDETISGMTLQQGVSTAGSLIGKEVSGISSMRENVTGVVVKVMINAESGAVVVTDSGDQINVNDLTQIQEVAV